MILVDREDDEEGQRILVPVCMLRELCMAALLEMAEQQFGHGQHGRGVFRNEYPVQCDPFRAYYQYRLTLKATPR